jgi:hypothetical protein
MCVLCYTPTSAVGEAIVFGGPFAIGWVKHQRARLSRKRAEEEADQDVEEVVDRPARPVAARPIRPTPVADAAG